MYASGRFNPASVISAFDALAFSVLGKDAWRPTHISRAAMAAYASGNNKEVQRAHGALSGRYDRHRRTQVLMTGPELEFDTWWKFALDHDKTVLLTKQEHGSKKVFLEEELFPLPPWPLGMFDNAGKTVRFRKSIELRWVTENFDPVQS